MSTVDRPDAALVTACRVAAAVSGAVVVALLLFYALELRAPGQHVFGPISDIGTVTWDLVLIVVVIGLRPALGTGRAARAVAGAAVVTAAVGAVASALLVVDVLPFEIATSAALVAILVQSLWLHLLSRALRGGPWSTALVRLGWWAPVAQGVGAVVVGASLALPWGTLPQLVVLVAGIAIGLPAWAAWPVWFELAAREIQRRGVAVRHPSHPPLTQEPSRA